MSYGIRKSKHTKNQLLERIAKTLGIRAADEVIDIGNSIFPALVMNAVRKSDFNMLDKLRDYVRRENTTIVFFSIIFPKYYAIRRV